ncbi:hypothetical protein [Alistipes sp.]|uniref:hypothetical protein n=1 Tax=Alistipes sp. TaxID=1872444 RepID=UPI003AEFD623
MPRELTFVIERRKFQASPLKIDRRKLYGWTEIEATDDDGEPCEVVSADETGRLIIPRGGTAVGLLSPDGRWVERSELKTVTAEGHPAELLPSSFDTDIALDKRVTATELLDHDITDFYLLSDAPDELVRRVGGDIYTFRYCYTAECEGTPAFVLATGEGLFLLLGRRLQFDMVGYEEPGFIDEEPDDEDEAVDFAMFG